MQNPCAQTNSSVVRTAHLDNRVMLLEEEPAEAHACLSLTNIRDSVGPQNN